MLSDDVLKTDLQLRRVGDVEELDAACELDKDEANDSKGVA